MTVRRNSVKLNGVEYHVRGPVIAQPVSDFAANVRIGEPSYETRQGAGYAVFETWEGGPGIQNGLIRQDLARIADTTGVDTRFSRQATAPLATVEATDSPDTPDSDQSSEDQLHIRRTNRAMQHYRSSPLTAANMYDLFFYGSNLHWNKPSDWASDWVSVDSTLDVILDACQFTPADDTASLKGNEWIVVVGKDGWRVMDTGGAGTSATLNPPANTDDGYLYRSSAVDYATARADGGTAVEDTLLWVGQKYIHGTTTWTIYRAYLRFDTGTELAATDVVTSATLRLYLTTNGANEPFTIQVRKKTWGAALTTADWSATPSDDTLLGTFPSSSLALGWNEITLDPTQMEDAAYTDIYLVSDQDDDDPGTDPKKAEESSGEYAEFESESHGDAHDPELVLEYHSAPTELADKEIISCLPWGDKLFLQVGASAGLGTAAGDIVVTLDADAVVKDSAGSNADIIWSLPYGNFLGPAAAPWGEMAPYFITDNDLYVLSFYERAAYKVPVGLQSIRCGCTWSDSIILTDGYNIKQLIPGSPFTVRHIGLPKEQGFLGTKGWRVDHLWAVDGGSLYALLVLDATTDLMQIWEYTGAAWHPLGDTASLGANTDCHGIGLMVTDRSLGGASLLPQKAYWLIGTDLTAYSSEVLKAFRIEDPSGDPNPLIGTATFSTTLRTLITPWFDGGFKELKGAALQMWFGGFANTDETVSVAYGKDGAAGFSPVGTFNGGQTHFNFGSKDTYGAYPGIEFQTIRFRVSLTATANITPNALPLTFVFRKKPGLRMSYQFNIDVSRELKLDSNKTFAAIMIELATAWNLKTLVRFQYPVRDEADTAVSEANLETDKRVDMVSMPSRSSEIKQAMRKGVITVQLAEPVDW